MTTSRSAPSADEALRRSCGISLIVLLALAIVACGGSDEEETSESASTAGASPPSGPAGNQSPWVAGKPRKLAMAGSHYSFQPNAGDPDGDTLSFSAINLPDWARISTKTGRLTGVPAAIDAGRYANVDIEVSDGDKTSRLGSFTVDVVTSAPGSIAVSWIPATERVDGSPLSGLLGHGLHWGTEPGNYTESVFIEGEGVTAYVIDNLLPDSYYIAATTVDADGIESDFSSPVSVTLQ